MKPALSPFAAPSGLPGVDAVARQVTERSKDYRAERSIMSRGLVLARHHWNTLDSAARANLAHPRPSGQIMLHNDLDGPIHIHHDTGLELRVVPHVAMIEIAALYHVHPALLMRRRSSAHRLPVRPPFETTPDRLATTFTPWISIQDPTLSAHAGLRLSEARSRGGKPLHLDGTDLFAIDIQAPDMRVSLRRDAYIGYSWRLVAAGSDWPPGKTAKIIRPRATNAAGHRRLKEAAIQVGDALSSLPARERSRLILADDIYYTKALLRAGGRRFLAGARRLASRSRKDTP